MPLDAVNTLESALVPDGHPVGRDNLACWADAGDIRYHRAAVQ